MDLGFFTAGLVTGLREGVEAALIVSIVLAYLARSGNRRQFGRIWTGVVAALVLSLVVGLVLFVTIGGLKEPAEQLFEGLAMTLAAVVVTWMLFWMRRQAASVKSSLHASVERALTDGSAWGLAILAFTAIIREGIETSLFLLGQTEAAARAEGVPRARSAAPSSACWWRPRWATASTVARGCSTCGASSPGPAWR